MILGPGEYFGQPQQVWGENGLTITLSNYTPHSELPWHVHTNPGLFLVLGGEHRDRTKHHDHDQAELTIVYHPTTVAHAGVIGPRGAVGLNVEYTPAWLERNNLCPADLGGYRLLESISSRLHILTFVATVLGHGEPTGAALESVAIELLEPLVQIPSPPSQAAPVWLHRVEDYLREHFRQPVGLRECAVEAGVHPVHLARVFRRRHGRSVGGYVRDLRLFEAGRIVLRERATVCEAAHRAGFADHAHFTRLCSRLLGFCPRALRGARGRVMF